jgi:hypothetical protein
MCFTFLHSTKYVIRGFFVALDTWRGYNPEAKEQAMNALRILLAAGLLFAADAPKPFRSPQANAAKAEYDRTVARAKAEYDKVVKAAGEKYAGILHAEMVKATMAGELDNALRYRREKERVLAVSTARRHQCGGVWDVRYVNGGTRRWYAVSGETALRVDFNGEPLVGKVRSRNDQAILTWADGTCDVLVSRAEDGGIVHYNPGADLDDGGAPKNRASVKRLP